jgi:hypothetical protein
MDHITSRLLFASHRTIGNSSAHNSPQSCRRVLLSVSYDIAPPAFVKLLVRQGTKGCSTTI